MTRSARRAAGLIAVAVVSLLAAPTAFGATPSVDIHSAGPLSDIYIGNDLSCQVRSGGFFSKEFFPNATGTQLPGPRQTEEARVTTSD